MSFTLNNTALDRSKQEGEKATFDSVDKMMQIQQNPLLEKLPKLEDELEEGNDGNYDE